MIDKLTISMRNGGATALVLGNIVRVSGNNIVVPAQGDSVANSAAVLGVILDSISIAVGGTAQLTIAGLAQVLLETGLAPTAGQTVYVSGSVAGRGAVAPGAVSVPIGVIKDASRYTLDGTVTVIIIVTIGAAGATQEIDLEDPREQTAEDIA